MKKNTIITILVILAIIFVFRQWRNKQKTTGYKGMTNEEKELQNRMEDIKSDPHERSIVEKEANQSGLPFEDVLKAYAKQHP